MAIKNSVVVLKFIVISVKTLSLYLRGYKF
mgnify:CR=1 FL=1